MMEDLNSLGEYAAAVLNRAEAASLEYFLENATPGPFFQLVKNWTP